MLLVLHIMIALSSIIYTAYLSFFPSRKKLMTSYVLVFLTIASGTVLTIMSPTHILSVCVTGLLYIGVIVVGISFANMRLAGKEESEKNELL